MINRLPTTTLKGISPLEALLGSPPQYSSLKVFGCSCFPHIRYSNQLKLQYRSIECTSFGYSLNHKGYKCLDPSGKIIISRDVLFNETSFPFAKWINTDHSQISSHTNEDPLFSSSKIPCLAPDNHNSPDQDMETDQIKPASTSSNSPSIQEPLPDSTDTTHPIVTSNKHGMQTRSKSGIYKPKVLTVTKEPSTIQEALQHEYWQAQ